MDNLYKVKMRRLQSVCNSIYNSNYHDGHNILRCLATIHQYHDINIIATTYYYILLHVINITS